MIDNLIPENTNSTSSTREAQATAATHAEARHESSVTEEVMRETQSGETTEVEHVTKVTEDHDGERFVVEASTENRTRASSSRNRNLIIIGAVALVALASIFFLLSRRQSTSRTDAASAEAAAVGEKKDAPSDKSEIKLSPQALAAASIQIEGITQRPAIALLRTTGTVEANPGGTQQVTPLVGGRVEQVNVAVGNRVGAGAVLATISSPEVAEMHGKLREAETRLDTAQRNLQRVQRTENRVNIISAKAKLDEAEATLRRTRRIVELGAGAGKDVNAAEAAYKTAKADFDFQSNIPLNRELQEAQAEVRTAEVDATHLRQSLRTLGAPIPEGGRDNDQNISRITVRAPASGIITERAVNAGAGISAGTNLFTISNLSIVYVIANVPEANIGSLREGTPAEIRSAALGGGAINGRISYIDPRLSEETRTARARIEVPNPGERLKAGMFVEVGFQTTTGAATGEELMVPSSAVQRDGERTFVFLPKDDEPGAFEVRDVELGGEIAGYNRVISGLQAGERVVTKGSFTLKTQLKKGDMSEE